MQQLGPERLHQSLVSSRTHSQWTLWGLWLGRRYYGHDGSQPDQHWEGLPLLRRFSAGWCVPAACNIRSGAIWVGNLQQDVDLCQVLPEPVKHNCWIYFVIFKYSWGSPNRQWGVVHKGHPQREREGVGSDADKCWQGGGGSLIACGRLQLSIAQRLAVFLVTPTVTAVAVLNGPLRPLGLLSVAPWSVAWSPCIR